METSGSAVRATSELLSPRNAQSARDFPGCGS